MDLCLVEFLHVSLSQLLQLMVVRNVLMSQSLSLEILGMNWIIISFAVFVSAFQAHITSGRPQTTQNAINELSLVTRYAGLGYSTLQANPEGDFYRGGINPETKTTRFSSTILMVKGNVLSTEDEQCQCQSRWHFT